LNILQHFLQKKTQREKFSRTRSIPRGKNEDH
jgi:hypothetical protein